MSGDAELQEEEREVLLSIYDGDPSFNQLSPITYQYKYGEDGHPKSFLLELSWGTRYPSEKPAVNMNAFYNKHLVDSVKQRITDFVLRESEQYLGEAMTYTLFESVKEKVLDLVTDQPETVTEKVINESTPQEQDETALSPKKNVVKKEQLSKAQKRKQWDRVDGKGEKPRGWDWVDIVKHLSQTGPKPLQESMAPSAHSCAS